jgi:hypothetical protein
VLRWQHESREVSIEIKTGIAASEPVGADLQRDADAYELCLAEIFIAAGATGVTQAEVQDTRANEVLCGYSRIYDVEREESGESTAVKIETALPSSGEELAANTMYKVVDPVGTYVFHAPASGWVHGIFTTASNSVISFAYGSKFLSGVPTIDSGYTYEFDALDNVWAVQEVVSE